VERALGCPVSPRFRAKLRDQQLGEHQPVGRHVVDQAVGQRTQRADAQFPTAVARLRGQIDLDRPGPAYAAGRGMQQEADRSCPTHNGDQHLDAVHPSQIDGPGAPATHQEAAFLQLEPPPRGGRGAVGGGARGAGAPLAARRRVGRPLGSPRG
jgi:hypothetical protein